MKHTRKKYKFIVEITRTGFSAYSERYAVFTSGSNFKELMYNSVEALNFYLEDYDIEISERNIDFEIDLKQFFTYYRVINSKFLAKRIGMNETLLSQYVHGRKKPSEKQTQKILLGLQEIGRELLNIGQLSGASV